METPTNLPAVDNKSGKANKKTGILIASVIIVVIIISLIVHFTKGTPSTHMGPSINSYPAANRNAGTDASSDGKSKSIDVPAPSTVYTASDDNFSVNFPTAPKVENTTYRSMSAGNIPLTNYTQDYGSGRAQAWYKVSVYHYPASYKFTDDFLEKSAQAYVTAVSSKYPGTKVANNSQSQFLGNPAIMGTLVVPVRLDPGSASTSDTNDYALATVKGQDLYIISAYGTSQDNYNAFVKSFKFQQ